MRNVSREEAKLLIASLRRKNGGISAENEAHLIAHVPEVLLALKEARKQLANTIKMYSTCPLPESS